jgi:hypothetical protein
MCCSSEGKLSRARNGLLRHGMMDAYFGRSLTERMRRLSLCKGYLRVGEEDVDGTRRRTSLPKVLEDG